MEFAAKLRKQSESMIVTIPNEIVKLWGLQEGEIRTFDIRDIPDPIDELIEKESAKVKDWCIPEIKKEAE